MKNLMQFILVLAGIMLLSNAVAADKVIVIPLNSSKPPLKLWGEGREGTSAILDTTANGINISRSNSTASWDGAAAACPANTWVCSADEVQYLDTSALTSSMLYIDCANNTGTAPYTWVRDDLSGVFGRTVHVEYNSIAGKNIVHLASQRKCAYFSVWCCSTAQ